MPDPISLPNQPFAGNYDPEANACFAPPAAAPAASLPSVEVFLPDVVVVGVGAQQLIEGYAQARAASAESAKSPDCGNETTRAAITCGQLAGTMLITAPTVLGAVVTGFFGGMACGFAAAEAYSCYSKRP